MTDLRDRIAALSPEQRALLESRVAHRVATEADDQIRPRDRSRPAPLSFAQQREWALERFRPSNNIPAALRLEGDLDLDLLSRSLTQVVARHEALRTTVDVVDRVPVQVVQPPEPVPVPLVDLSHLAADEQRSEVRRRFDAEVVRPFPPEQALRLRVTVLRLAAREHVAVLATHHSSSDGWSMSIIAQETVAVYRALCEGRVPELPPPPLQYGDFAVWQREHLGDERVDAELEHWRQVLADMPPRLMLPTDRPHPARRTFAGTYHPSSLSPEVTAALRRFAEAHNVSTSMVMLAACAVLLNRYTEQSDLVFGSAITGRTRTETEQVVGCFANALPLRMAVSRGESLLDVLDRARDVAAAAFDHQDIPFDRLIEELVPTESSQTPLIQMMINVPNAPEGALWGANHALEMPDLRVRSEAVDPGPLPIDLILIVDLGPTSLHVTWHYSTELFDATTVRRLADQLLHVVRQLVETPSRRVADVELPGSAPAPERPGGTLAGAEPPAPEEQAVGIVELIRRQVQLVPEAPAVVCDGATTSFEELDRQAERLARHLRALGVGPETRIGVLVDQSPLLAVAVLGALQAGGAFVPVDPQYPVDRIGFLLADCGAPVLVTTAALAERAAAAPGVRVVLLDRPEELSAPTGGELTPPVPTSAAYVIYTSGSTGRPKGVVVEHRSLAAFATDVAERLQLGAGDRFLQFASPGFDVLIEELFPIWLAGGAVVFPPPAMVGPALDVTAVAEQDRVSVMELPAAYWHEWVRELDRTGQALPPSLRLVIVGAERVLPERLAMWQKLGVPLMHVYGITETTVSSTFFRLRRDARPEDLQHLPIGTPLPSVDLRILDQELRAVPVGAVGELYLGGVGVARGYLGRPGLTAERFVADPDPARPGRRLYRSGDLVRSRADGNLEFLSRADDQIKIRGFRVEPAEIESAVCRHPQVAQAVVTVHQAAPGDQRLVAYLVPQARTRPNITDLRRFLARELPPYLVPSAFVQLETMPLTANGKIDHDRLPPPTDERPELAEEVVLPRTPLEEKLAQIVAGVLGVTLVGVHDNFFELGGDSILAIQVVARAQEAGLASLSPLDLFDRPTVALLAEAAEASEAAGAPEAAGSAAPSTPAPEPATEPAEQSHPQPTPEDFPLARVDRGQLDALLGRLAGDQDVS